LRDLGYTIEPFTVEDAESLMELVDSLSTDSPSLYTEYVEYRLQSVEELDLDALASSLHGITDPIGQIRDWFYDRLMELTSWFSDAVHSIFSSFWNTVISPVIDGIRSVVDSIWGYIQQVPGTVSDLVSWIGV